MPKLSLVVPCRWIHLGRVQKLIRLFRWVDRIVPFGESRVFLDPEVAHLLIGNLLTGLVVFSHHGGADAQAGLGGGLADQSQDGRVTVQGLPGPVFADLAE